MSFPFPSAGGRLVCALAFVSTCAAQEAASAPDPGPLDLAPFVVTGTVGAVSVDEVVAPTYVISAEALARRSDATLGEALAGVPGVSGSAYGAGAQRPVIRGYAGPRVRLLREGLESLDVSSSSPDHAVALDPAFARSVEVVRGPAVLLYGGGAIGGVINVRDRRLPEAEEGSAEALSGLASAGFASVSDGWDGRFLAEVPAGEAWAVTASLVHRDYGDYAIPGYAESAALRALEDHEHADEEDHGHEHEDEEEHAHEEEVQGTLEHSWLRSTSWSAAAGWFPAAGRQARVAFFSLERDYGVPGHVHAHGHEHEEEHHEHDEEHHEHEEEHHEHEEEHHDHEEHAHEDEEGVSIALRQRTARGEMDWAIEGDRLTALRLEAQVADYEHTEYEGDEVGTRFANEAWETRLEGDLAWSDALAGVVGLQLTTVDALAEGAEAFTPPTETRDWAVFAVHELAGEAWRSEFGLRYEERSVEAKGRPEEVSVEALSASLGFTRSLGPSTNLSLLLTRAQRPPSAAELFADGPHAATRRYEVGDASLGAETVHGVDLTWRLLDGPVTGRVVAFWHAFDDYLFAAPTEAEDDGFPVYAYRATEARFAGAELEALWHTWHGAGEDLHLLFTADVVRARDTARDEDLPGIPPLRAALEAIYSRADWSVFARLEKAWEQDRVAPEELPTDGYLLASAGVDYTWSGERWDATLSLRLENLLDEEVRLHASPLKDYAPLPGRGLRLGLRVDY